MEREAPEMYIIKHDDQILKPCTFGWAPLIAEKKFYLQVENVGNSNNAIVGRIWECILSCLFIYFPPNH